MKNPVSLKIKNQLRVLEKELRKSVNGAGPTVKQSYFETISAGGKRLRPAIVFLCSQFKGADKDGVNKAALAVEIIHAASLIHDDIMDGAAIRRGQPTIYSKRGSQSALRTGDYLFAKSFLLLNETGNFEAVSILSRAVKKLSEGELEQIKSAFNKEQELSYYYQKIGCKTAALFRASAELGALFGNAGQAYIKALGDYAENLGVAFQVYDDVLDIEADEEALGKSLGTDLKDGTLTLPIIMALKESNSQRLADIFTSEDNDEQDIAEGLHIIVSTKAAEKSKKEAKRFVDKATQCLAPIKEEKLKKELEAICEYTIERYN